jgi:hypothetical protein
LVEPVLRCVSSSFDLHVPLNFFNERVISHFGKRYLALNFESALCVVGAKELFPR